ncbi:MAG: molecular chaperone DnaJ, partial [Bacteroidales bacterium]|nr:molecular chaperone DnaJ [Bacteroidales bacterium]
GFGGFGNTGGRTQRVSRGSDIRIRVKLNLSEIVHGVQKTVKVPKYVTCPDCNGRGAKSEADIKTCDNCHGTGYVTRVQQTILGQMQTTSPCPVCGGEGKKVVNPCPKCGGSGLVKSTEEISFKIPAGVSEGIQLTVSGKGNAAKKGGIPGDLLVVIEEEEHPTLRREGNDLLYTLNVSVPDAIMGCDAMIPSVDGELKIKIEPGTQPGKVLRLRGKGIPDVNGYGIGDLLVYVQVYVPKKLDKTEKEIIERLKQSENFDAKNAPEDKSFFDRLRKFFN